MLLYPSYCSLRSGFSHFIDTSKAIYFGSAFILIGSVPTDASGLFIRDGSGAASSLYIGLDFFFSQLLLLLELIESLQIGFQAFGAGAV
jgi:hypothetical protein